MKQNRLLLAISLILVIAATTLALSSIYRNVPPEKNKETSFAQGDISQSPLNAETPEQVEYVRRGQLWPELRQALKVLGDRVEKPGKERLTLTGMLTRAGSSRPTSFVLIREFPDRLRLQEQDGTQQRMTVFNRHASGRGNIPRSEMDIIETLIYDTPEHFFRGQMDGMSTMSLGTRFRLDDGTTPNYSGPFYDIYQVTDVIRVGRETREQLKFYYFNSDSQLLERVRHDEERDGTRLKVEVLLDDWQEVQGQRVAGSIKRMENDQQVLALTITSITIAPRQDDDIFASQY